jgi:outer membrane protein assembly factor BamB
LWSYQFSGSTWNGDIAPAVGPDGTVYIGTYEYTTPIGGSLIAFDKNGQIKWQYMADGRVSGSAIVDSNGIIYIGSLDGNYGDKGHLYAVYPDGSLKWKTPVDWRVESTPAMGSDGTIYVKVLWYVYAINPDGTIKWTSFIWDPHPPYGHANDNYFGPSVGSDGTVYVTNNKKLYALSPADGYIKWIFETGGYAWSVPAIGKNGTVYVSSADGYLYALRASDGSLRWSFYRDPGNEFDYFRSVSIDAIGNIYLAGGSEIFALTQDGSELWRYSGVVCRTPSLGNDRSLFCGTGGMLYKFSDGLALRLPFEDNGGTTTDSSGNGNNGTVNGAVFTTGKGVCDSNAYQFAWSSANNIQVP